MMMRYYAVFVISRKPIDLGNLVEDPNVQHLVEKEFIQSADITSAGDRRGWRIEKSAPEHCDGVGFVHRAYGESISVVIADWFKNLCRSMSYVPRYHKNRS